MVNIERLGNPSPGFYELYVAGLDTSMTNHGLVSSGQPWTQPANSTCSSCNISFPDVPSFNYITPGAGHLNVSLSPGANQNPLYTIVAVSTANPSLPPLVWASSVATNSTPMVVPAAAGVYQVWAYAAVLNGSCTGTSSCTSDAVAVSLHTRAVCAWTAVLEPHSKPCRAAAKSCLTVF